MGRQLFLFSIKSGSIVRASLLGSMSVRIAAPLFVPVCASSLISSLSDPTTLTIHDAQPEGTSPVLCSLSSSLSLPPSHHHHPKPCCNHRP